MQAAEMMVVVVMVAVIVVRYWSVFISYCSTMVKSEHTDTKSFLAHTMSDNANI